MKFGESLEKSFAIEQHKLPENPEGGFETDSEQKFQQHKDKIFDDIESRSPQVKQNGVQKLDRAPYPSLPEEESLEIKKFTKQYSSFWRDQLAKRIRDSRKKFLEDKGVAHIKNLERSSGRAFLESEITATEEEFERIKTELEDRKTRLEEEKNRLINRIIGLFGGNGKIPDEAVVKELESKSEKLAITLEEKKMLLSECGDVILDEGEILKVKNEIRKFYDEQKNIHDIFKSEKTKERDISSISKEKAVLFVHSLPIDSYGMSNTSQNNPNIDTKKITSVDKTRMVLGIEPTISASTINLHGENTENKLQTMYPVGLIIGEGTALSAYGGDAGTYADNPFIRRSKYDRELKSAVQENFATNMDDAIKGKVGQATMQMGWNEVVIENPKVSGVFLDVNFLQISQNETMIIDAMKQAFKIGKEFGLPVYGIRPNGEMLELSSEGFGPTTQESVLGYKCELGTEERVEGVEKVLKTQEKLNIEIQRKLSEIQEQENSSDVFLKTQEQRVFYSGKSEQCLSLLEYEDVAKYVERTINRLGNVGLDEILRVAQSEGVTEEGLEMIDSLFGGKTTDQILSFSQTLIQKTESLKSFLKIKNR